MDADRLDGIEHSLVLRIKDAARRGDNDEAHELAVQLDKYRRFYKGPIPAMEILNGR